MNYKAIEEFPQYSINTSGQVMNNETGKILSQSISSKGYYQINIGYKSRRVHR